MSPGHGAARRTHAADATRDGSSSIATGTLAVLEVSCARVTGLCVVGLLLTRRKPPTITMNEEEPKKSQDDLLMSSTPPRLANHAFVTVVARPRTHAFLVNRLAAAPTAVLHGLLQVLLQMLFNSHG